MTECTCWVEYPNESHRKQNGKWKCVDDYECIRPLDVRPIEGMPCPKYVRKTKCRKKVNMAEYEKTYQEGFQDGRMDMFKEMQKKRQAVIRCGDCKHFKICKYRAVDNDEDHLCYRCDHYEEKK